MKAYCHGWMDKGASNLAGAAPNTVGMQITYPPFLYILDNWGSVLKEDSLQ